MDSKQPCLLGVTCIDESLSMRRCRSFFRQQFRWHKKTILLGPKSDIAMKACLQVVFSILEQALQLDDPVPVSERDPGPVAIVMYVGMTLLTSLLPVPEYYQFKVSPFLKPDKCSTLLRQLIPCFYLSESKVQFNPIRHRNYFSLSERIFHETVWTMVLCFDDGLLLKLQGGVRNLHPKTSSLKRALMQTCLRLRRWSPFVELIYMTFVVKSSNYLSFLDAQSRSRLEEPSAVLTGGCLTSLPRSTSVPDVKSVQAFQAMVFQRANSLCQLSKTLKSTLRPRSFLRLGPETKFWNSKDDQPRQYYEQVSKSVGGLVSSDDKGQQPATPSPNDGKGISIMNDPKIDIPGDIADLVFDDLGDNLDDNPDLTVDSTSLIILNDFSQGLEKRNMIETEILLLDALISFLKQHRNSNDWALAVGTYRFYYHQHNNAIPIRLSNGDIVFSLKKFDHCRLVQSPPPATDLTPSELIQAHLSSLSPIKKLDPPASTLNWDQRLDWLRDEYLKVLLTGFVRTNKDSVSVPSLFYKVYFQEETDQKETNYYHLLYEQYVA